MSDKVVIFGLAFVAVITIVNSALNGARGQMVWCTLLAFVAAFYLTMFGFALLDMR